MPLSLPPCGRAKQREPGKGKAAWGRRSVWPWRLTFGSYCVLWTTSVFVTLTFVPALHQVPYMYHLIVALQQHNMAGIGSTINLWKLWLKHNMQLAQDHKENARRSPWKLLVSGHLEVLKHMGAPCRTPPSQPTGGMGEAGIAAVPFRRSGS